MNQKIIGVTVGTPHRPDAVSKKIGPLLVTVAQNEDGSYAVDKTYGELVEAKSAGRTLRCRYYDDDVYLPFTAYHGVFTFSAVIDSKLYQIDITAAGQSQEAQAKVTTTPLSSGGGGSGEPGKDGADGITPHIGDNGNWWIGEEDTGVSAGVTDAQISGAVEEYMEENPLVKTVNGTAPDENGNVVLDIPPGGGGGSSEGGAFCSTVILEEDVSVVSLQMPVNWGRIIQFNIHADTMGKSLAGEMNWQTEVGGAWNIQPTLSTNLKGIDFYGIRYMWDDTKTAFAIGSSIADNASDAALPTMGVHFRPTPRNDKNNFGMFSTTEGVMFPKGMRFDVWGVYAP